MCSGTSGGERRALAIACAAYRESFGRPVGLDVEACHVTVTPDRRMSMLVIPEPLASAVVHGLISALQPAVVLSTGRGERLTFFTIARPPGTVLPCDLDRAQVRTLPAGRAVVLPVPGRSAPDCRWVVPPGRTAVLPHWSVVVALARRALQAAQANFGRPRVQRPVRLPG